MGSVQKDDLFGIRSIEVEGLAHHAERMSSYPDLATWRCFLVQAGEKQGLNPRAEMEFWLIYTENRIVISIPANVKIQDEIKRGLLATRQVLVVEPARSSLIEEKGTVFNDVSRATQGEITEDTFQRALDTSDVLLSKLSHPLVIVGWVKYTLK